MMKKISVIAAGLALVNVLFAPAALAQRQAARSVVTAEPMIFAVLNDGKSLEPIGSISKGTLEAPAGGDATTDEIKKFVSTFYKKGQTYQLIFGGARHGSVTVNESFPDSDCAKNIAGITSSSTKAKLTGKVMALATNVPLAKPGSGVRRLPTPAERVAADNLVKAEFAKQGNSAAIIETRDYHNLTALDVDGDGKIELVGSFWVKPDAKTRNTLFFIADKGTNGKYKIGFGKYNSIKEESVMSGDISSVDDGIYHELLLDVFDIDGDGASEVFTYVQSFEGAGFNVYRRSEGKWDGIFNGSNYHCGF